MKKFLFTFAAGAIVAALLFGQTAIIGYRDHAILASAPANPPAGFLRTYALADGYECKDPSGEACISGGGSGEFDYSDFLHNRVVFQMPTGISGAPFSNAESFTDGTTTTSTDASATEPMMRQNATAATIDARTRQQDSTRNRRIDHNPHFKARLALGHNTNVRYMWGLSTTFFTEASGQMLESDDPDGHYAAFRWSSTAPDTNFKCLTKDGTTQNVTDSGVAPTLNATNVFEILVNSGTPNVVFKIDGTTVCTHTTNLPASTQLVRMGIAARTLAEEIKHFRWAYLWTIARDLP